MTLQLAAQTSNITSFLPSITNALQLLSLPSSALLSPCVVAVAEQQKLSPCMAGAVSDMGDLQHHLSEPQKHRVKSLFPSHPSPVAGWPAGAADTPAEHSRAEIPLFFVFFSESCPARAASPSSRAASQGARCSASPQSFISPFFHPLLCLMTLNPNCALCLLTYHPLAQKTSSPQCSLLHLQSPMPVSRQHKPLQGSTLRQEAGAGPWSSLESCSQPLRMAGLTSGRHLSPPDKANKLELT